MGRVINPTFNWAPSVHKNSVGTNTNTNRARLVMNWKDGTAGFSLDPTQDATKKRLTEF